MLSEKSVTGWEVENKILNRAKMNDKQAVEQILRMYHPLLVKNAMVNGKFEEDLYQELIVELLKCIQHFKKME